MKKGLIKAVAASVIYAGFAFHLYRPYLKHFGPSEYLFVANSIIAALGCFVLSRRWISGFWESLFAGALYGFGPFLLCLAQYHPTAGSLAAAVPWLFLPAAFWPKGRWRWLSRPLCLLPFLAIVLFFQVSAQCRLFAISTQAKLRLADLAGLLAPLVTVKQSLNLVGFYHVGAAALLTGFVMLFKARRFGIVVLLAAGTVLAFWDSFLQVSPVMWLAVPVLCCSVLVGVGMQGLVSAGSADRGWVLAAAVVMMVPATVTLLLAAKYFEVFAGLGKGYARLFVGTAFMYILGAVAVGIIYFMARVKLRLRWLRLIILCSATAVDIFWGATFVVDQIFYS